MSRELSFSFTYNIDTFLKEAKTISFWDNVITKAIGGAVIGGVAGAIIAIANKKKKNAKNNCCRAEDI